MSLLGKKVELIGVSQRGKNRVKKYGHQWRVLAETNHILFSPNMPGDWLFISPGNGDLSNPASCWIRKDDDPDFKII